jgi:hypothetical protein
MGLYRKKPVVIEARKLPDYLGERVEVAAKICAWANADDYTGDRIDPHAVIHTLEGDHRANLGDWIIKGVKDEFYPCKPDIFEATYEPANED